MGSPSDKKPAEASEATAKNNRPGRVEVDARGRNVWRWNTNGEGDSTSVLLKRLDNDALALEPTQKVQKLKKPGEAPAVPAKPGAKSAAPAGKPSSAAAGKPAPKAKSAQGGFAIERQSHEKGGGGFDPYNSR